MRKLLETLAMAGMFATIVAKPISSADLVGHVVTDTGQPAPGVQVSVLDSWGASVSSVVSDAQGSYEVRGLQPGPYTLVLKGQSVMSYVPKEGLTANWAVSNNAPPLAIAKAGASPMVAKVSKSKPEPDKGR